MAFCQRSEQTHQRHFPETDLQYAPWGGQACNPYDTARIPRGTSNGSGAGDGLPTLPPAASASRPKHPVKAPASRNGIASILTTKGVLGDGGITSDNSGHRAGIHCKTLKDAVIVLLDAIKGYKSDDIWKRYSKGIIPAQPYTSFLRQTPL